MIEIAHLRQRLEAMDGGPAAADAQQAVEERTARLASEVERYARLRLASAVLREAVERYRKEHQAPVLDRAGGPCSPASPPARSPASEPNSTTRASRSCSGVRADGSRPCECRGDERRDRRPALPGPPPGQPGDVPG